MANILFFPLETAVDHNSERDGLVNEYSIRQKMLTREIQDVKKERAQDVSLRFHEVMLHAILCAILKLEPFSFSVSIILVDHNNWNLKVQ